MTITESDGNWRPHDNWSSTIPILQILPTCQVSKHTDHRPELIPDHMSSLILTRLQQFQYIKEKIRSAKSAWHCIFDAPKCPKLDLKFDCPGAYETAISIQHFKRRPNMSWWGRFWQRRRDISLARRNLRNPYGRDQDPTMTVDRSRTDLIVARLHVPSPPGSLLASSDKFHWCPGINIRRAIEYVSICGGEKS